MLRQRSVCVLTKDLDLRGIEPLNEIRRMRGDHTLRGVLEQISELLPGQDRRAGEPEQCEYRGNDPAVPEAVRANGVQLPILKASAPSEIDTAFASLDNCILTHLLSSQIRSSAPGATTGPPTALMIRHAI